MYFEGPNGQRSCFIARLKHCISDGSTILIDEDGNPLDWNNWNGGGEGGGNAGEWNPGDPFPGGWIFGGLGSSGSGYPSGNNSSGSWGSGASGGGGGIFTGFKDWVNSIWNQIRNAFYNFLIKCPKVQNSEIHNPDFQKKPLISTGQSTSPIPTYYRNDPDPLDCFIYYSVVCSDGGNWWVVGDFDLCLSALDKYIAEYALTLSQSQLNLIIENLPPNSCNNQEFVNCTANKLLFFARDDIKEIINHNLLIDPCTKNLNSLSILENFVNNNCQNILPNSPLKTILASLPGVILGGCEKANCIFKKITEINDDFICNVIQGIKNQQSYGIYLAKGTVLNNLTGAKGYAKTDISKKFKEIIITFDDENICNSDAPLIVAETIIHEFLHTMFFIEMMQLGWDKSEESKESYWNIYLNNLVNETGKTSHEIMVEYYLDPICEALWKLNGQTGDIVDYRGYVLYGLFFNDDGSINPFISNFGLTWDEVVLAFETSKNVVPCIDSFNFNCNL